MKKWKQQLVSANTMLSSQQLMAMKWKTTHQYGIYRNNFKEQRTKVTDKQNMKKFWTLINFWVIYLFAFLDSHNFSLCEPKRAIATSHDSITVA